MEKFNTSAKVIDGTLILTLPNAVRPVVWQMQLGQTKSSALEVREQNDGNWLLVLKTPRMDVMEIAPFATKEKAVKALMAVSRAMEKAQGQIASYSGNAAYPVPAVIPGCARFSWLCRLLRGVLYAFLALVLLILLWSGVRWVMGSGAQTPMDQQHSAFQEAPLEQAPAGAPVSADDFLNNQ